MSLILYVAALPAARAQWAVIDVGAIAQLIEEVQTLRQQLMTAQAQLNQAEAALATTTGNRGMQLLAQGLHFLYELRDRADVDDGPLRACRRRGSRPSRRRCGRSRR